MFQVTLTEGALFYGETRRRVTVPLDAELRQLTEQIAIATACAARRQNHTATDLCQIANAMPARWSSYANPSVSRGPCQHRHGLRSQIAEA